LTYINKTGNYLNLQRNVLTYKQKGKPKASFSLLLTNKVSWKQCFLCLAFQSFDSERYSINAPCALYYVSMNLLIPLGRCLCWWIISRRGHHLLRHWYCILEISMF